MRLSMRDWRLPALVVAGFIFARMTGGRLPFFLLYLSAGLFLIAWLWTRHALRKTECLIQIEKDRMEVGESLSVRVRLDNDTMLPLPWAEVDDATPQRLVVTDMPRQATSVPLLGSRIIHFRLTARRRGHYAVGPIRVNLGDAFGLFQGWREFRSRAIVTIYPRVHRIERLFVPLSQPFGPVRTREKAFEDPSNQAELREYRAGDNPRHIHWKTSARVGELMLREYELNATTPMMLFPDLSGDVQAGDAGADEPSTEEVIVELAASLAAMGLRRKIDVGLVCHGQERFAVNAGRGQRTFHQILEVLARVEAQGLLNMEKVLELETAHLPGKSTVIIMTPRLTTELSNMLIRLRFNHQVVLVLLRKETFGKAVAPIGATATRDTTAAAQSGGAFEASGPVASLTGLLTLRKIPVYVVSATDDLRRLAELRLAAGREGVKGWSPGVRRSDTRG